MEVHGDIISSSANVQVIPHILSFNGDPKAMENILLHQITRKTNNAYFLAEIEGPEQKSDSETKKDCRCCWILTSLHSKWIFWSYRSPIGALSTALESRHPGLSSNI
ncbi:uncharacterized protein DS421_7g214600 [Arachis hypogaea]|nr:uncharacterized protein DS421_7g214600 [Arachis hypogaea]